MMHWRGFGATLAALLLPVAVVLATGADAQRAKDAGERLARKIDEIDKNAAANPVRSKKTAVSELELNSYLAFNLKDKIPRGLANPEVQLVGNHRLVGRVFVDMDEFRRHRSSSGPWDPLSYVSGQVPLTARGTLHTQDGRGKFQLASAEIHGVPLPKSIVQELVSFFSRSVERPRGINIDAPFALPAKIREIAIQPGEALVVQ
jgi:hypothetical protein